MMSLGGWVRGRTATPTPRAAQRGDRAYRARRSARGMRPARVRHGTALTQRATACTIGIAHARARPEPVNADRDVGWVGGKSAGRVGVGSRQKEGGGPFF